MRQWNTNNLTMTRSVVLACSVVIVGGCSGYEKFLREQSGTPETDGSIEASGAVLGTWSFAIRGCESGASEGFYGVTFHSDDKLHAVRLVHNAVGPMTVAVNLPGSDQFAEVPCYAVVGKLERTGVKINSVPVLRGTIQLACEGLRGAAVFTCW